MSIAKKFVIPGALAVVTATLIFSTNAFAHVTVKPAEVATASYQTFTINVPNEKTISTTALKVDIPEGVTGATPTVKPGWTISTEKDGQGETARVTSITWTGGEIADGLRDEFTFSAKTPEKDGKIEWKAYQTYADGTVVSWNKAESDSGHGVESNSGPFSVTNVSNSVTGEEGHLHDDEASKGSNNEPASRDWALYTSVAALVVGLGALFVALRKK